MLLLASSLGWFSNPSRLFSRRRPWKGSLSYNKTHQCCYNVTQSLLPQFYITIGPKTRIGSIFVTQCAECFIFLGRSWESERSRTNVHDLPWHGHAGPHASNHTGYGSASVYGVSELSGPRTENQPQGPLQSMRWSQDHAAEEDFGGPHRQRWERRDMSSRCDWRLTRRPDVGPNSPGHVTATGMKDGQKIVFHGEGDQEPGIEPGDIIIVLDQREHPHFTRWFTLCSPGFCFSVILFFFQWEDCCWYNNISF